MSQESSSLEESLIASFIENHKTVIVHLRNGAQLQGIITALSNGVIFLKNTFVQRLYLHRISHIKPVKPKLFERIF